MTAGVQEHGPERLSCTLKETARSHTEGNHEKCRTENAERPGGHILQFQVVRRKRGHQRFGLPHHDAPCNKHEAAGVDEGELQCTLDAVVQAGAVVVADNRLRTVHETQ